MRSDGLVPHILFTSSSRHSMPLVTILRPVSTTMQPRPDYFIVRPDTKDGMPGSIVPLIAVDQLPDWMQLVGVPRELDIEQTIGLTSLGIGEREGDNMFEVRLHCDKIRAILGCADEATEDTRTTTFCETKGKGNEKVAGNEKTLRPHMTKATSEVPRPTGPRPTTAEQDKQRTAAFCRHWCYHGTCKWGLQCRHVHRMPTTVGGLREVGLKGFPAWYLTMMSDAGCELSGSSSIDTALRRLEDVQISAQRHVTTQQPQPLIQHHVPDPGLAQGYISALLALDNTVSNKQKLRQIREMRHLLLHGGPPTQEQLQPRRHINTNFTNLYANARVAASAVSIRRQAERQQQTRDNVPVVRRVRAGARSSVENDGREGGDDDDGGGLLPGRKGVRASNDCADVVNVRSPGFVTSRAASGEEKLVDID